MEPRRLAMQFAAPIELERDARIMRNKEMLRQLVSVNPIVPPAPPVPQPKKRKERPEDAEPAAPAREAPPVTRNAGAYKPPREQHRRPKEKPKPRRTKAASAQQGGYAAAAAHFDKERALERRMLAREQYKAVHHHGAFDSDSDFDLDDEDGLLPGMDADGAARLLAEAAAEEPPAVVAARRAATRAKCGARGGVYFASRGRTLNGARGGEGEAAALPLADEQQVRALLREMPPSHAAQRAAVLAESEKLFPRWKALLGAGFSVLLYGLGSKREVIEAFRDSELCSDGASVCVHGHHPSLTTRILLSHCIEALALPPVVMPGGTGSGAGARLAVEEASLRCIAAATAPGPETEQQFRLYVFIHSVDGVALRNPEAQACLASLAALPGVGLLASCDHVNAPLLWHKRAAGQLKWVWEHVSTFARLDLETRHAPPLLRPAGEERARRGAAGVLLSLTPNARTVFKVLAEEQLRGGSDAAGGLPFARWFELCRSTFSVSSETQLRAHLGEFVDHGLVKRLRRTDGVDAVLIKLSVEDMRAMIDVIAGAA